MAARSIRHGQREGSAFDSPADWDEPFDAVKGALLEDIDDPATSFRGFWRYEPGVPDELRRTDDLDRSHTLTMPEPRRSECRRIEPVTVTPSSASFALAATNGRTPWHSSMRSGHEKGRLALVLLATARHGRIASDRTGLRTSEGDEMRRAAIALIIGLMVLAPTSVHAEQGGYGRGAVWLKGSDPSTYVSVFHFEEWREGGSSYFYRTGGSGLAEQGLPACHIKPESVDWGWGVDEATFSADTSCGPLEMTWTRVGPVVKRCSGLSSVPTLVRAAPADVHGTLDGTSFSAPGFVDDDEITFGTFIFAWKEVDARTCP